MGTLPTDLKHYRAPSIFQLIDENAAGYALAALLVLAFIADRMGWLA